MRGDCPACGYPQSFTIRTGDTGKPVYWCASCRDQDALVEAMRGTHIDPLPESKAPPPAIDKVAAARSIWNRAKRATGTLVETYLRHRGIYLPCPPTLRFLSRAKHLPSEKYLPVMVAAVTVWPSREPVAIHRTYLERETGRKAPVDPAKKTLGPIAGGAVRLDRHGPVLVVGEGIETTLSVMGATGLPGWAALSAGNLPRIVLPEDVRHVFIAADHDTNGVGMRAAEEAAAKWREQGRITTIALPANENTDFNDALQGD
jgi:putative DNA primase/helicase